MSGIISPRENNNDQNRLRVFGEENGSESSDGGLWPGMSLGQFFEQYIRRVCLLKSRRRNITQYEESLELWKRATGDPPLAEIDQYFCAQFIQALSERRGRKGGTLSDNTIRKHCIPIQYCLDRAGPFSRRSNPLGANLIIDPPALSKPSIVRNEVDGNFQLSEIGQWLNACHLASAPKRIRGVDARDWWQSLVVFDYNVGVRLETLLAARWDWIIEEEDGPWLHCPSSDLKGRKRGRKFYLNPFAMAALKRIQTDRDLLFPWEYSENYLQATRRSLLEAAAVAKHRRFGFHGLRKAMSTELGKINELAPRIALGHASGDVTVGHYLHRGIYVAASKQLPQPTWRKDCAGEQLLMF